MKLLILINLMWLLTWDRHRTEVKLLGLFFYFCFHILPCTVSGWFFFLLKIILISKFDFSVVLGLHPDSSLCSREVKNVLLGLFGFVVVWSFCICLGAFACLVVVLFYSVKELSPYPFLNLLGPETTLFSADWFIFSISAGLKTSLFFRQLVIVRNSPWTFSFPVTLPVEDLSAGDLDKRSWREEESVFSACVYHY